MAVNKRGAPVCDSCLGSGEIGTDLGPVDCPDCGGSGFLPSHNVLVDWRSRDIERRHGTGETAVAADVRWLLAEVRRARSALTQIVALAHDLDDGGSIPSRIRFVANEALGLYPVQSEPKAPAERDKASSG